MSAELVHETDLNLTGYCAGSGGPQYAAALRAAGLGRRWCLGSL